MCKYRYEQYSLDLNLYSASINKIIVTKLMKVKLSQNLNLKKCQHSELKNLFSKLCVFKSNRMFGKI